MSAGDLPEKPCAGLHSLRKMTGCAGVDVDTGEQRWVCSHCGAQFTDSELAAIDQRLRHAGR